jgi:hypothetical protein
MKGVGFLPLKGGGDSRAVRREGVGSPGDGGTPPPGPAGWPSLASPRQGEGARCC